MVKIFFQALGSHAPIVPTKLLGDPEELDRHLIEHGYTETFSHALTQPNFPDDTYIYSRTSSELDIHVNIHTFFLFPKKKTT